MSIKTADKNLSTQFMRAYREGDGCLPESDERLNGASRSVIRAYHKECGECWLGQCNPPNKDTSKVLVKYDPAEPIYNFSASFVIGRHDAELEKLLVDRLNAEYTTATDDGYRVDAIMARMAAIGGRNLFWT